MFSWRGFVELFMGIVRWYRSQPPAAPIQQPPVRGLVSFGGPVDPAYAPSAENLEAIARSIRSQKPIEDRIKAEAAAVTLAQTQITECLTLLRDIHREVTVGLPKSGETSEPAAARSGESLSGPDADAD
jgi:hypothetical protein